MCLAATQPTRRLAMTRWFALLFITAIVFIGTACSPAVDTPVTTDEITTSGGTQDVAGNAGIGSVAGNLGDDSVVVTTEDPTTENPAEPDEPTQPIDFGTCGATVVAAQQVIVEEQIVVEELVEEVIETEVPIKVPVAIYLMLDESWSMVPLWPGAYNSINAFVNDPISAGVNVAIQYFPFPDELVVNRCDGTGYDTPAVPMGELSAHAAQITDNLATHAPIGIGTPTEGALRGATEFCHNYQQQNPDVRCVAVLITDGEPNGCDQNHDNLVNIATQAYANDVMTFAVGLAGADFNLLNRIAMEGGGEDCDPGPQYACDVTADAEGLVEALNRIRDSVAIETHIETHVETHLVPVTKTVGKPLECEWQVPEPDPQYGFDVEKVNVRLTAPSIDETMLGKVDGLSNCVVNGWYFDDPSTPTRIIACPETCTMIQSTFQATVDIQLGCPTVYIE